MTKQDAIHVLPTINATLNGLSAVFLTAGFVNIKRKNIAAHKVCMISAFTTSVLFLICYVTYHILGGLTKFVNPVWFKPWYLLLLGTHIFLAIVIIPLILITLNRAFKERFALHKQIARWTWPLWMYVSVTGVLVYLILYIIFPQPH
jgi:putative membrane protein